MRDERLRGMENGRRAGQSALLAREDGVAMLTVLMLTIILTVIGIAAITTTTMDLKLAGGERVREGTVNAAEACLSSAVQIIQQTLQNSAIPSTLTASTGNPRVTASPLQAEILGQLDQYTDSADPSVSGNAPNAVLTLTSSNYTVNMDIDRLYVKAKAGGSLQFAGGYEGTAGGAAGGGLEIYYRVECYARSGSSTTASGRVSGVYACVATGDTCQRKI